MRTSVKLLAALGLALSLSAPAGAVVTIGLVQIGGTYDPGLGANPGDTLHLSITYSIGSGDTVQVIDPAIVFDGSVQTAHDWQAGSTETGLTYWLIGGGFSPKVRNHDILLVGSNMIQGWEKTTVAAGGVGGECSGPTAFCTTLGTASFTLSGLAGTIEIGGMGLTDGTLVLAGSGADITGTAGVSLGSFFVIPEPTTACLLGLGLVALTGARRAHPHRVSSAKTRASVHRIR